MKKKIKLVKEYGALWRIEHVRSSTGNHIISTKIRNIRHKNVDENSMVVQNCNS